MKNFVYEDSLGFQLTLFLKVFKLSISLQSFGSMDHIFSPKNETIVPWHTDFTGGLEISKICLKFYRLLSFCEKVSFIIGCDRFC